MKKILLIDRLGFLIEAVLRHTDWHISLLIVQDENTKERYLNNTRIDEIYHSTEFLELESPQYIDFDYYKNFEECYRKVDSGMRRIKYDYQYSRYQFFMGLSVWKKIFDNSKFDFCILSAIEHGITLDTIPIEIAKSLKIPFYSIEPINRSMCIVYDQNNDCILDRIEYENEALIANLINTDAYYFKDISSSNYKTPKLKQRVGNIIFNRIGSLGYIIFMCIKNKKLKFTWYPNRKIDTSLPNYLECFIKWKYILYRNSKKNCVADYTKKYIVYFLHFEPEAVVVNYTKHMDSQLINIKMLASALPSGWRLYVKEHPISGKLNSSPGFAHFIEFYHKYNSNWYWDEIRKIDNVRLLKTSESATKLIQHAEIVSTIAGTVIMESIIERKPVLILGDKRKIVFSKSNNVYVVNSFKECETAVKTISTNGYIEDTQLLFELSKQIIPHTKNGHDMMLDMIEHSDVRSDKR